MTNKALGQWIADQLASLDTGEMKINDLHVDTSGSGHLAGSYADVVNMQVTLAVQNAQEIKRAK